MSVIDEIKSMLENVDPNTRYVVSKNPYPFASTIRPGYIVLKIDKETYDKLKKAKVTGLISGVFENKEYYGVRAWFRTAEIPHPTLIYGENENGFAVGLSLGDLIGDRSEWLFFHILHIDLLPMKWSMDDGIRSGITIFIDILKISKAEPPTPIPWDKYIHRKENRNGIHDSHNANDVSAS